MKRKRYITATELAECCVCEQRVVFDRIRGRRRTRESRRAMAEGSRIHAELHREAVEALGSAPGDGRCFVATALWGTGDPRTDVLRAWRDRRLLPTSWGPPIVNAYYAVSPAVVRLMRRMPAIRRVIDAGLSVVVRLIQARGR